MSGLAAILRQASGEGSVEADDGAGRDIWSAGHGVGDVKAIESVSEIVESFAADCQAARRRELAAAE